MAATNGSDYYEQVVIATQEFLGPAAERFIKRQIDFHLDKDPHSIDRNDVLKLKESLRVTLGLLVNDVKIVNEAVRKFDLIANDNKDPHADRR